MLLLISFPLLKGFDSRFSPQTLSFYFSMLANLTILANRVEFASEWFMLLQRNFSFAELSTAKDILFSVAHMSRAVRSVCISSWVLFTAKFFKSSEETKDSLNFRASGNLFMNKQSKGGPRIGLCGTPLLAFFGRIASTEA